MNYLNWSNKLIEIIDKNYSNPKLTKDVKNVYQKMFILSKSLQQKSMSSIMYKPPEYVLEFENYSKQTMRLLLDDLIKENPISKQFEDELRDSMK